MVRLVTTEWCQYCFNGLPATSVLAILCAHIILVPALVRKIEPSHMSSPRKIYLKSEKTTKCKVDWKAPTLQQYVLPNHCYPPSTEVQTLFSRYVRMLLIGALQDEALPPPRSATIFPTGPLSQQNGRVSCDSEKRDGFVPLRFSGSSGATCHDLRRRHRRCLRGLSASTPRRMTAR